jgi:cysteine synthase A
MLFSGIKTEYPTRSNEVNSFKEPHPVWRPHLLQGWAPDWIPSLVEKSVLRIDEVTHIGGDEAMATSKALAQQVRGLLICTSRLGR